MNLEALVTLMRSERGIVIKDRRHRLKLHPECFVGSEAVTWLMQEQGMSWQQAIHFGQQLIEQGLIHHVLDQHPFKDGHYFYRFYEDEGKKKCPNCAQVIDFKAQTCHFCGTKLEPPRHRVAGGLDSQDLEQAREKNQFKLLYQPMISLKNCRVMGFEALLRWQHPRYGWISPAKFIPLAEQTDLILSIDQWVLREASHQMNLWQREFPNLSPIISINISAKQFSRPCLINGIREFLTETHLNPQHLHLEITESIFIQDFDQAAIQMAKLRALGVKLSLDDFGTGYCSLNYLQLLPIDTIKIDRTFIGGIGRNDRGSDHSLEIVRTLLTLGQKLGKDVIAEGVETYEHLTILRMFQCPYAQGYLFSKPLPAASAIKLLGHHFQEGQNLSLVMAQQA